MIKMTKNINEATFVTHAGNFHADDVFSTAFMEKLYGDITLIRLKDYKDDGTKLTYDIGLGKFDHHGPNPKKRLNGTTYCGFGLLWQEFGLEYLTKINVPNPEKTKEVFDYLLVNSIDAIDNGEYNLNSDYNIYMLDDIISLFRPSYDTKEDEDTCFLQAVEFAKIIFDLVLKDSIKKVQVLNIIKEKIPSIKNKTLILDEYIPYEYAIFNLNLDVDFVIYPSNRGGYAIHTVPTTYKGFIAKTPFPKAWAGLRGEQLAKVCGVKTAQFCHNKLFLATSDTLEDAQKLANLALAK